MLRLWKRKTGKASEPAHARNDAETQVDASSQAVDLLPANPEASALDAETAQPLPVDLRTDAPRTESVRTDSLQADDFRPAELLPVKPARTPWHLRIGTAPRPQRSSGGVATLTIATIAACLATGVALRKTLVAAVPESAGVFAAVGLPVNLRGLELRDVKSGIFAENAVELLVVQGEIANVTSKPREVPPLLFTVRDAKGVTIYSWSASADIRTLEPGAKASFRRRLASPPPEGMEVLVRFSGKPEQLAAAP